MSWSSAHALARGAGLAVALVAAGAGCRGCDRGPAVPPPPPVVAPPLQLSAPGRTPVRLPVVRVRRQARAGGVVLDLASRGGPNGWATAVVLHLILGDDGAGHRAVQLEGSRCDVHWLPGGVETAVDYGVIAGTATPAAGGTTFLELSLRCAKRRRVGAGGALVAPGLPDEVEVAVSLREDETSVSARRSLP